MHVLVYNVVTSWETGDNWVKCVVLLFDKMQCPHLMTHSKN